MNPHLGESASGLFDFAEHDYEREEILSQRAHLFIAPHLLRREPHVGDFSDEEFYDYDADCYRPGWPTAKCPRCGANVKPLLARESRVVHAGWRWVGLDYQEPYTEVAVRHARCGGVYRYTTHSPQ